MKKLLAILFVAALASGAAVLACGAKADVTGCSKSAESIERTVQKMDNGVRIMLASNDAKMVQHIQEKGADCKECCKGDCPLKGEAVTRVVETTERGVMITATSTDAEMVKALQAHAAGEGSGCKFKKGQKAGDQAKSDGGCKFKKGQQADQVAASH